ncbi:MAG: hypothetical protein COC12_10745 [Rhodobacteraceae bacterium]|nr:MAG: hypothetical protein COC12_10745 [Paracoccaceae bacterium]
MSLRKIHRWNALFLGSFILLHMATHLSGLWGIEVYNAVQKTLRLLYRNPIVEPLLAASVLVQMGLGLWLLLQGLRRRLRSKWGRVQAISGMVFLFFLTEHMLAFVLARWVNGLDTNFYWPASVMSGPPFIWYFVPYYFFGVVALFIHMGCGFRLGLLRRGRKRAAINVFWGTTIAGGLIAGLIVLTLLGVFYRIELPGAWVAYLRQFVAGYTP